MANELKIKPLTIEQIVISLDRLTRFKNTGTKYLRVFCDIITHNLISPQYKKSELEQMDFAILRNIAQKIINYSLESMGFKSDKDYTINKKLMEYEKTVFRVDAETEKLLDNNIDYKSCLNFINCNSTNNLRWLKSLPQPENIILKRQKERFYYPLEVILIAEGATEEILLPEFGRIYGYDFSKEGIYVVSAGGKNQVVKLYYELCEILRLPIFVLLDKDGVSNYESIAPKLRKTDNVHILKCGEFEDLLSFDLIKRTLDYELKNISIIEQQLLEDKTPRVKFLEEILKKRGMHEFKKADFAKSVKKNINTKSDLTPEIVDIIEEIKQLKK